MTIWTDLADIEFKLYYLNANGIKTRVLEAGNWRTIDIAPWHWRPYRGICEKYERIK